VFQITLIKKCSAALPRELEIIDLGG